MNVGWTAGQCGGQSVVFAGATPQGIEGGADCLEEEDKVLFVGGGFGVGLVAWIFSINVDSCVGYEQE